LKDSFHLAIVAVLSGNVFLDFAFHLLNLDWSIPSHQRLIIANHLAVWCPLSIYLFSALRIWDAENHSKSTIYDILRYHPGGVIYENKIIDVFF
jgi:hypothetical protein